VACKTLVKMRLCRAGAKWKEEGAAIVLSLRSLVYTAERWQQFWNKVDRYTFADGEPACTISHIGHMGTYSIRKDSDARTHDIDCPNC